MFTGLPRGVRKAKEQASAIPMAKERGSAPIRCAAWMAMGTTTAATAAPFIAWVSRMARAINPARIASGPAPPSTASRPWVMRSAAPVLVMAVPSGSMPATRKMLRHSIAL